MTYKILISRSAEKELFKLSDTGYKRIAKAIDDLAENPRPAGVKKLKGGDEDFWRIRVGQYRIIYAVDDDICVVDIRKVGNRRDIYKKR